MEKPCHRYGCEVAFADTDASGWVHFSRILAYAENAEHDFLRKRGIVVFDPAKGGWPRVKVSCEYLRPLVFQEQAEVLLFLRRIGRTSLAWTFEILGGNGELAARGEMIAVKVNAAGQSGEISQSEKNLLEGGA